MSHPTSPPPAPPAVTQGPLPLAARIQVYLSTNRFYNYRDVLAELFAGNEDAFVDAWVSHALPAEMEAAILDTMQPRTVELLLLRRLVRLQGEILAALK